MRSSLVPHAVLLMRPRTLTCTFMVLRHRQKAVRKNRPGRLLPSTWCFWVVHESTFHLWTKAGFQLMCGLRLVFSDPVTYYAGIIGSGLACTTGKYSINFNPAMGTLYKL